MGTNQAEPALSTDGARRRQDSDEVGDRGAPSLRRLLGPLVVGWVLGIVTTLAIVSAFSGYDYRLIEPGSVTMDQVREMVNRHGWEPVAGPTNFPYLRRPRFRLW